MSESLTWNAIPPTFSIVMPVHDPDLRDLERAIASVRAQAWPAVELCVVDDGSTDHEVCVYLDRLAKEPGVRSGRHSTARGIAAATNAAIALATGDFLVFLDHDDELVLDALSRIAEVVRDSPDVDFIYSDHDIVDEEGVRLQTAFKPDWSPELLLSYMYVGHVKVARRSLAEGLGGFREGFPGAADHDFMLRVAEATDRIAHVPEVLYHWRAAVNSMARSSDTKSEAFESGRRAVADALTRRGIDADAEWPAWAERARLGIFRTRFRTPDPAPKVSILIPTRDRLDLLRDCIASIEERTDYPDWEIWILDNDSREVETRQYLESSGHPVLSCPGDFNFSRIVNQGAEACDGDYIVLLNNDTIVVSRDWLDELVGSVRVDGVGIAGAKLLYPDGRIQHAGVTLGIHGLTAHAFDGLPDRYSPLEYGYFAHVCRNVSAVTAACLVVSREDYREVGGFDEEELGVAWNDTDFCLRARRAGRRVVMNPYAELIHMGSASRGDAKNDREVGVMFERWSETIERDPFYNPNLSRLDTDFRLRTRIDEAIHFHYSADGFRQPSSRSRGSQGDRGVDAHSLRSIAPEIARGLEPMLDRLSGDLARFESADRVGRWLGNRPLWRRFERSRFASWCWRWAARLRRTRGGEAFLRRIGLIG